MTTPIPRPPEAEDPYVRAVLAARHLARDCFAGRLWVDDDGRPTTYLTALFDAYDLTDPVVQGAALAHSLETMTAQFEALSKDRLQ
jgi:hypothetical protein